jgi:hypothetical protein
MDEGECQIARSELPTRHLKDTHQETFVDLLSVHFRRSLSGSASLSMLKDAFTQFLEPILIFAQQA